MVSGIQQTRASPQMRQSYVLTAVGGTGAGLKPIATANGWSLWPITLLYSAAGLPAFPWNASITSVPRAS